MNYFYADLFALYDSLERYGKRRQNQHSSAGLSRHILSPYNLNECLSHTAVCEYGSAAFSKRPFDHSYLEREQLIRNPYWIKTELCAFMIFIIYKAFIVFHILSIL